MNTLIAGGVVVLAIGLAVALYVAVIGVAAFILTWAWNLVVPTVFGGPVLDFGAAFALLVVLAVIRAFLFGSRDKS